jgi:aminoglycoside phosphotransferase family enzyme
MIEDLMKSTAYSEKPKKIKFVQTHISNVFIGEEFVYKIKKPVNFGFLDFSTLEKRHYYCKQEVELNSRFSTGIYLGVFPVTFTGEAHIINGNGKIVDYAVKMKRLSDDDLMKTRFKKGEIKTEDIKRIGKAIANFHMKSKSSDKIVKFGKINAIKLNTDENFQQTTQYIEKTISKEKFNELKTWTNDFYEKNQDIFSHRLIEGKIKDCHGDLHMEHVCLTDPIIIFDCIEFNERFRYIDTLSDLAFLLMDLEYNSGKDFAQQLFKSYISNSDELDTKPVHDLVAFYKVYRAYVRGKVNSLISSDKNVPEDKKNEAKKTATKYFDLSYSYIT